MLSIKEEIEPDSDWNKHLLASGLATIYQTKEWSKNLKNIGQNPIFLSFYENNEIVAQLLVSETKRFTKKGLVGSVLKKLASRKIILTWSYGPIIFNPKLNSSVYMALEKFLLSKKCKIFGSQHPLSVHDVSYLKHLKTKQWGTFLINLNQPKKEIYEKIDKHSGRKNIERAMKRGVIIEEITENNLQDYVNIFNISSESMGREKTTIEDMLKWWKLLTPLGYSGFLAKKDDKVLSGMLFSYLGKFIIEGGIIRSDEDKKNNLYSQDLIKWKIIEWGIDNKMNYYNLAGFNPNPISEKEKGILRYKKKWRGEQISYWLIQN